MIESFKEKMIKEVPQIRFKKAIRLKRTELDKQPERKRMKEVWAR